MLDQSIKYSVYIYSSSSILECKISVESVHNDSSTVAPAFDVLLPYTRTHFYLTRNGNLSVGTILLTEEVSLLLN